jgi:predicted RNA-binding protein YlqC (UPF0109 family)
MKIMSKRASELAKSLKQLGDIQVTDWDFMELLNTEIKDLELSRSLKRLGRVRVMDWDFRTVLPAVRKVANQEVDVVDFFKRTAHYKVMDWDFRSALHPEPKPAPQEPAKPAVQGLSSEEMQAVTLRLKNFVQYVAVNLIDEPDRAQIKITQMGPAGLRLKLVLVKKDVAMLIGREGFTAAAIRSIVKATAAKDGVQALLQIHSHEEEAALLAKEEARR